MLVGGIDVLAGAHAYGNASVFVQIAHELLASVQVELVASGAVQHVGAFD